MFGFTRRIARRTSRRVARRQARWRGGSESDQEQAPREASPEADRPPADHLDDLERLARLKEQGHLSDEEFAEEKRRLLES